MGRRRLAAIAFVLLAPLTLTAVGCTPGPGPAPSSSAPATVPPRDLPPADDVAAALAEGLSRLDVTGTDIADPKAVNEDLKAIFAGMDGIHPAVAVAGIEYAADADEATVTLENSYPVGINGWKFETKARLTLERGAWRVAWSPQVIHPQLTSDSRLRHLRKLPKRAPINDADGLAIVEERSLYQVGLDKAQVAEADWPAAAEALARLVGIDPAAYTKKVLAGGPKQFVVAATMRQEELSPDIGQVPGGQVVETKAMVAPSDTFAASLLGRMGHPSPEQVTESEGRVFPDDMVGVSGLQSRYEDRLRGVPQVDIDLVGRKSRDDPDAGKDFVTQNLFHQDSSVGDPLTISLDRELQAKAEQVLSTQSGLAALVVVRPSDGALLVAANSPTAGDYPQATFGKFAPGSTFKVVSSLAMLRGGFTPSSPVKCPPTLTIAGHQFGNYADYPASMTGTITLTQALANSCNTAFVAASSSVTPAKLHEAAGSLGVGTDYDAGFTSNFGTVEPNNSPIDRAASMIGQGQITMSPLAMAGVAASVASGRTTIPWLVEGVRATPTAPPLTAAEAASLQQMMAAVVTEGSGRGLAGLMTGAKTGTAEFGQVGKYQTHAWMIAWNGNYAVAAFVEVGESGSKTAAPLIRALFS